MNIEISTLDKHLLHLSLSLLPVYRIRGQFPKVRYFSIQTYTFMRQPIDGMADYEIIPVSGINPFNTPPSVYGDTNQNGYFEVYITANGDKGRYNKSSMFLLHKHVKTFVLFLPSS